MSRGLTYKYIKGSFHSSFGVLVKHRCFILIIPEGLNVHRKSIYFSVRPRWGRMELQYSLQ